MQNRNSFQTERSRSYQTSEYIWSHSPVRELYSSIQNSMSRLNTPHASASPRSNVDSDGLSCRCVAAIE